MGILDAAWQLGIVGQDMHRAQMSLERGSVPTEFTGKDELLRSCRLGLQPIHRHSQCWNDRLASERHRLIESLQLEFDLDVLFSIGAPLKLAFADDSRLTIFDAQNADRHRADRLSLHLPALDRGLPCCGGTFF